MSVFWPSDTESWINELKFSESISLSLKNEAYVGYLLLRRRNVKLIPSMEPEKHVDVTSRNVTLEYKAILRIFVDIYHLYIGITKRNC